MIVSVSGLPVALWNNSAVTLSAVAELGVYETTNDCDEPAFTDALCGLSVYWLFDGATTVMFSEAVPGFETTNESIFVVPMPMVSRLTVFLSTAKIGIGLPAPLTATVSFSASAFSISCTAPDVAPLIVGV